MCWVVLEKKRRIYLIFMHVWDTKDIGKSLPRDTKIFLMILINPTGNATRRRGFVIETKDIKYSFETHVFSFCKAFAKNIFLPF